MEIYAAGFDTDLKADGSPVTEADLASSVIIHRILAPTEIPILGEEVLHQSYEIRKNWTQNWCVDPLDGTKEYIKRNGEFVVNIALIENEAPIFGLIASPVQEKIIFGGKETGVFWSHFEEINRPSAWRKIEKTEQINQPLTFVGSRSHASGIGRDFLDSIESKHGKIDFIQKGSALKFFDLAFGKADFYPRFAPTMEWDIAAGQAILEALDGNVLDAKDLTPLKYNKESLFNPHFIAKTNALLRFENKYTAE